MKAFLPLSLLLISSLISPFCQAEPTNLGQAKSRITHYVTSGDYQKELANNAEQASKYLKGIVAENKRLKKPKKLAVVFDIDETVLSNYPLIKKANYCANAEDFDKEINKANGKAIPSMKAFYQEAKAQGVDVFFITGRPTKLKGATLKNLKQQGFKGYKKVYFKPKRYAKDSTVANYKTAMRKNIEQQGYVIVLNLGDQESDLAGGEAMKAIKLPNPFYYIP